MTRMCSVTCLGGMGLSQRRHPLEGGWVAWGEEGRGEGPRKAPQDKASQARELGTSSGYRAWGANEGPPTCWCSWEGGKWAGWTRVQTGTGQPFRFTSSDQSLRSELANVLYVTKDKEGPRGWKGRTCPGRGEALFWASGSLPNLSVGRAATEEDVKDFALLVLTTYPSRPGHDSTNIQSAKGNIFFFSAEALLRNNVQLQLCAEMNRRDPLKSKRKDLLQCWIAWKNACAWLSS